jgi:hypothetical protein
VRDEFPRQAFLSVEEVKTLLGLKNHKEWGAFLASHPTFPAQVPVGKTAAGHPRMRYPKRLVLAFLDLLGA